LNCLIIGSRTTGVFVSLFEWKVTDPSASKKEFLESVNQGEEGTVTPNSERETTAISTT